MKRAWVTSLALAWSVLAMLSGCSDVRRTDSRLATPERTIATLMGAYGVAGVSEEALRTRIASHESFRVDDPDALAACFTHLNGPADEGLAGFVFGALAAGRDHLRIELAADRATVSPRAGVQFVLVRDATGAYRFDLEESVPAEIRTRMAALASQTEQRLARGITHRSH